MTQKGKESEGEGEEGRKRKGKKKEKKEREREGGRKSGRLEISLTGRERNRPCSLALGSLNANMKETLH